MQKRLLSITCLLFAAIFFSCSKPSSELSPTNTVTDSGSGGTVNNGGGGTGGNGGTGNGGTGGGGSTGGGGTNGGVFNAKFNIDVADIHNIFETTPVKLVATGTGIVKYTWTLGDGRRANANNLSVIYPYHGYYTVTLTVEDANGKTDSETKSFSVLCNFGGGLGGNTGSH